MCCYMLFVAIHEKNLYIDSSGSNFSASIIHTHNASFHHSHVLTVLLTIFTSMLFADGTFIAFGAWRKL
ncbi:hypothetical protein L208DRAFT_921792 [Tricholoma matsutake]|nr:hypothetical protein L208DRAFT_921792 [Tricholoma matsutake 945]